MKIKMMEENVNRFKNIRNSIMEIYNIEDSQIAQYNKMVKMKFQLFAQIAVTRNNLILFGKIMLKKKKEIFRTVRSILSMNFFNTQCIFL